MDYIEKIIKFSPISLQEINDKKLILEFISKYKYNVLKRENEIAHITSSGFIMNKDLNKALMIHHNIRKTWAWTGGHADGDSDLLHVAIKEAKEETGIINPFPLSDDIISIDILPVFGHMKKGKYISSHLHLSISYVLICSEDETLKINKDETGGVKWFNVEDFTEDNFSENDVYLYNKIINKAKLLK